MNPTFRALVALCIYGVCLSSLATVASCDGGPNPGDNGSLADASATDGGRGGDLAGKPDADASVQPDNETDSASSGDVLKDEYATIMAPMNGATFIPGAPVHFSAKVSFNGMGKVSGMITQWFLKTDADDKLLFTGTTDDLGVSKMDTTELPAGQVTVLFKARYSMNKPTVAQASVTITGINCPTGTQTYACKDDACCITDLEKVWYERLLGKDCENVDTECLKHFCYTKLDAVNSSAYVPENGAWDAVMKDGVKDVKYAGKRVLSWYKKGDAAIMDISNEKLEMWTPQYPDAKGNFARYQMTAELLPNGAIVVTVTLWNCSAEGVTTTKAAPPQKYDVK